jgi:membrane protein YdbS with pleckstrin-like domain
LFKGSDKEIFGIIFAWLFCIPVGIAMYAFAVMAAASVMIAFTPFWVLSAIVNMFRGKDEP